MQVLEKEREERRRGYKLLSKVFVNLPNAGIFAPDNARITVFRDGRYYSDREKKFLRYWSATYIYDHLTLYLELTEECSVRLQVNSNCGGPILEASDLTAMDFGVKC